MKRITTTFFICLLLGITSLHAERDNYTQRTPEKQPEFITGFRYLPPGFECFADMFKYKEFFVPFFKAQDICVTAITVQGMYLPDCIAFYGAGVFFEIEGILC